MAKEKRQRKIGGKYVVGAIILVVFALVLLQSVDFDSVIPRTVLSYDKASGRLEKVLAGMTWRESHVRGEGTVDVKPPDLERSLPPIANYPLAVAGSASGAVVAEIFVSTEKSGSGTDGWMVEAAEAFNRAGLTIGDGRKARVSIRKIASGTGYQFIASGKYRPAGYSPSNHLWVRMAEARGRKMTPISEKTVGNIAGIVMKEDVADEIEDSSGAVTVQAIIDATVQGKISVGYTNPYASSTGLNFLATVLMTFAGGDESKMLSPEIVSAFEAFQRSVPFVAMTTLQMRESVRQDGSLDAFVMEYQTYIKTDELQSGYRFIPFGILHDNPLYAIDNPDSEKMEALRLFGKFMKSNELTRKAADFGFNPKITYDPPFTTPSGKSLVAAQQVWKEKKDAGRRIAAVFLADVSGSMNGDRIRQLSAALIEGSGFIAQENSIGLVTFSNEITILLPIKPFKLVQKSAFHTAVTGLSVGGNTAMYDGVAVSLSLLVEQKLKDPEIKPILFVLTDGKTNEGMDFNDMDEIVEGLGIPVYTIGFEANIGELRKLSGLVEAASLDAQTNDIRYTIGSLLNSQM